MFSGFLSDWSQALTLKDTKRIEELVSVHADDTNSEGQTALMLVAQTPSSELASLLLPYSLHVFDPKGRSALHYAVEAKNTNFLELFLIKTWLKRDEDGMSPIETAIMHGNAEPLKFFLQHRMLLQNDLEAARILASECRSKEIVDLLAKYEPLSHLSMVKSLNGEEKTPAKFNSSDIKALIARVKEAISSNNVNADELVCELIDKAAGTPALGKALTLFYSKRIKDLKTTISNDKQVITRLAEDVDSGVSTLSVFMNEVQRLTQEAEEREKVRAGAVDSSTLASLELNEASVQTDNMDLEQSVGAIDEEIQCINFPCDECLRMKQELDNCSRDLENVKEKLRLATAEIDEHTAKLQKTIEERDEALDKLNSMIAASTYVKVDRDTDTFDVEKAMVDGYVTDLIKELRHTKISLENGGSENQEIAREVGKSAGKTADELISMIATISNTESTGCKQSVIEVLFSNLTIFLVELLKEKHIAKAAILEKVYLENAIKELHLTAHLDSQAILSRGGRSFDVPEGGAALVPKECPHVTVASDTEPAVTTEPTIHVTKIEDEDLDMLDDAEALGKSLSAKDLDTVDSPSKYTASFIKSAIREASSMSSFTSDKLAELPQQTDVEQHRALSDISSTTLSSISFVSHNSSNSVNSAPGGTRHVLAYGDKRSNTEMIISQMVKLSAEKPRVSGKQLPLPTQSSSNTNAKSIHSQSTSSQIENITAEPSAEPKGLFGKRNAELNKSNKYLVKSSYQPPIIADGRSPLKSVVADISNCWIRSSSPLNKYNANLMKRSNPYDFYGTILSKSRSISTPLAKSQGPDITE
ncbi:Protein 21.1 [Giardia duodenalis assemblage B]|uniref:Protein 21.1 n=1 Tax=Giardia duodenalis assemblage B TaxID=1394984 RepID=A0A132P093_GIAIN|nr:Protein 21.1 [Giardia intestinalis assemblage B]